MLNNNNIYVKLISLTNLKEVSMNYFSVEYEKNQDLNKKFLYQVKDKNCSTERI